MKSGLIVVPALFFIGNVYLYHWALRQTNPPKGIRKAFFLGLLSLLVLFPVSKIWGRHDFNALNHLLNLLTSAWMGISFLLILGAVGTDLLRLSLGKGGPAGGGARTLSRRRLAAAFIFIGGSALAGYAFYEARDLRVTEVEIPLRSLPPELEGLSLVHLSDIHYGMLHQNGNLGRVVQMVNEMGPDLVVITGDLVDEAVSHMEEMALPLSEIKGRLGVFAVMGNHEFFAGADRAEAIMRRAGIRVLRNEIQVLPGGLQILGVDDPTFYRRSGLPPPDVEGLLSGIDPGKPSLFLYHQPLEFDKASRAGVGLQLSGHLHGPQLLPMVPLVKLFYPHLRGLFQEGESFLYVSRGVGTGGPPMRLGSPPEIVRITLRGLPPGGPS